MRVQHQEETLHGLKLFDYIHQRNGRVTLTQLEEAAQTYRLAQQLKLAGNERTALLLLDRELAQRMPTAAAAPAPAGPPLP
jgi:ferritin